MPETVEEIKTYLSEQDKKLEEDAAEHVDESAASFHPDFNDIDTSSLTEEQRQFFLQVPPGDKPN